MLTTLELARAAELTNTGREVVIASDRNLSYVIHLSRQWTDAIGFIPATKLAEYCDHRRMLLAYENGTPAGFLNWTIGRKAILTVHQVCVDPQLLRTKIGTDVMTILTRAALRGHASAIRLTSAKELDCNYVWPNLGFIQTAQLAPRNARRRSLIEWTMQLPLTGRTPNSTYPDFLNDAAIEPNPQLALWL